MAQYPDPDALLAGPLGTVLETHEEARRAARRKSLFRILVAGPIAVGAFLFAVLGFDGNLAGKLIAGGAAMLSVVRWSQAPKREISDTVKLDINAAIADAMDLEYSSEVEPGWSYDWAEYFSMVPNHDDAEFEDLWHGEFEGSNFTLYEAHLKEWRQQNKSERLVTVFHGSILSFDTQRDFEGTTLFRKKRAARDWMEGKFLSKQRRPQDIGLGQIDLESSKFADKFDCFTDHRDQAVQLLTPKLQGYLLEMEAEDPSAPLYALFHEGHFVLVAPSGNMFESGSASASKDRRMIEATIEQFRFIANIAKEV